jgi:hypothetical protein
MYVGLVYNEGEQHQLWAHQSTVSFWYLLFISSCSHAPQIVARRVCDSLFTFQRLRLASAFFFVTHISCLALDKYLHR